MDTNVPEHGFFRFDANQLARKRMPLCFYSIQIALKSFTLVCVGPVMTRSPSASK